jgi:hypothetical protein
LTWCPWCQNDPKDGTENRICPMHVGSLLQSQEPPPVSETIVKIRYGVKCLCCGYVNPAKGHKLFRKVDV